MNRRARVLLLLGCILLGASHISIAQAQNAESKDPKMVWFEEARLGIFIHWGIYAVDGIDESWSFFNRYVSYEDYMAQLNGFTASRYDPIEWASIIKQSGARYAVLTAKHHDGVALWDTELSNLNVVQTTPAGRDLIGPFVDAVREEGLNFGLYFSHIYW